MTRESVIRATSSNFQMQYRKLTDTALGFGEIDAAAQPSVKTSKPPTAGK
jgi:hypothetical protein